MRVLCAALFALSASTANAETPPKSVFDNSCARPDWLRQEQASTAYTTISFRGTEDGRVTDVKVVKPSGYPRVDDYLVGCISAWRFDPASGMGRLDLGPHSGVFVWDRLDAGHLSVLGRAHACIDPMPQGVLPPGMSARTVVRFFVTVEGGVRLPEVDQSSGYEALDQAALQCVSHWRYRPARDKNGDPVEVPNKAVLNWYGG